MLWSLIRFHLGFIQLFFLSHLYREEFIVNSSEHHHYRRLTSRYKKKQSMVKNFWIGGGLIALIFPFMHVFVVMSLLTTLLSFSYLDESD